jgi:hypothetical protein
MAFSWGWGESLVEQSAEGFDGEDGEQINSSGEEGQMWPSVATAN